MHEVFARSECVYGCEQNGVCVLVLCVGVFQSTDWRMINGLKSPPNTQRGSSPKWHPAPSYTAIPVLAKTNSLTSVLQRESRDLGAKYDPGVVLSQFQSTGIGVTRMIP